MKTITFSGTTKPYEVASDAMVELGKEKKEFYVQWGEVKIRIFLNDTQGAIVERLELARRLRGR